MDGSSERFISWSTSLFTSKLWRTILFMIACHKKIHGATCFEDIHTIHGVLHPAFKSARMALGLLNDDGE